MSYLHYFTNRYRNRVSRKREFFNLYKIFVIQNKQKAIRFSFQNLTALLSCCVPKSSIFTCNICTKSRGLFSGYFSAAYAFRTLILLTFGRSFQRVPWQMNKTLIIRFFLYFQVFQPFLYSANLAYIGITWHSFVSKRCKIRCKNIAFTPRYFTR